MDDIVYFDRGAFAQLHQNSEEDLQAIMDIDNNEPRVFSHVEPLTKQESTTKTPLKAKQILLQQLLQIRLPKFGEQSQQAIQSFMNDDPLPALSL